MLIDSSELIHAVELYLRHWFSFPKDKVFAQVTTVMHKKPHIRTMELYHFTPNSSLIFLTDTRSPKWSHLNRCPNVGICLVNPEHGQIIVEGRAILHTSLSNLPLTSLYWHNYLDEYWRNYYLTNSDTSHGISLSFGVIQTIPTLWQILEINKNAFLKSSRVEYKFKRGMWSSNPLPLF
ncbi:MULTISPECIES: pyridoxamine 5'-phosphate oxidase family protein [Legionella]|uniref:Pyridoxamine 5'-phosphate oxidase family protein n=1 Tax=Legionella resiliens TaxID=2905958 RepID=A0ABS8X4Y8_9GAMM|nr:MULTISPECIES: pyridoxamine 5'-phosphate oxidase family protein [unclassified Legionella]MCE0724684.1 pyridoxamine 5'-phosphate oxidase family protein [Legionella sp. 9fVS26]MCE3533838.1 pyridoxamine 5'-phosphate oxidase family protein [Legionella sp. 8cVS16]QLZ70070.1 pyridoxamine 5'-phosphate oxidase family protein [Legionella sp. PC1000]